MAQGPNPIEVYEQARAQLRPILAASSAKLSSSTPCTEWNVQSLINHAISVQQFAQDVLGPGTPDPSLMGQVDHPLPSDGAEAALNSITNQVLATLKSINLADTIETPFGSMPGGQFIMVPITDMIIHTWEKFQENVSRVLSSDGTTKAMETWENIPEMTDIATAIRSTLVAEKS